MAEDSYAGNDGRYGGFTARMIYQFNGDLKEHQMLQQRA